MTVAVARSGDVLSHIAAGLLSLSIFAMPPRQRPSGAVFAAILILGMFARLDPRTGQPGAALLAMTALLLAAVLVAIFTGAWRIPTRNPPE